MDYHNHSKVESIRLWDCELYTSDITRNQNGKITEKTVTLNGETHTYKYQYDDQGRLIQVTKDGSIVEEYGYDSDNTRISERNTLRGIDRSLSYDQEDKLLTAGNIQYQYSVDGFLTEKTNGSNSTQYEYSSKGELLKATLPDGTTIEYTYGPKGRRLSKAVNGTITRKYLWASLTKLLAVYDGNDNLLMRFNYADSRMPASMTKDGQKYYLIYNQVGTLRAVADTSGNVVKRLDYDTFGNVIQDSNPTFEVPFRFAGGLYDKHTELIRFGHRDYDPETGRWTAKDPILFAGGDTNLYGYCLNDPVNLVDPLGLCRKKGESFKGCLDRHAKKKFGLLTDIMDNLGYYGYANAAINAGSSAISSVVESVAKEGMNHADNAGARAGGNILKKLSASSKGARTAARIGALKTTLGAIAKVSGITAIAASGVSVGMRAVFYSDCSNKCEEDDNCK